MQREIIGTVDRIGGNDDLVQSGQGTQHAAGVLSASPAPGFWTDTARELGEEGTTALGKLRRGLGDTAITGVSLYLMLYGIGTLLIPAPRPPWVFTTLALIGGLAFVPVWSKRL